MFFVSNSKKNDRDISIAHCINPMPPIGPSRLYVCSSIPGGGGGPAWRQRPEVGCLLAKQNKYTGKIYVTLPRDGGAL